MPTVPALPITLITTDVGIDSERGIAWRAADSLSIRAFLRIVLDEMTPDHSTISGTRQLSCRLDASVSRRFLLVEKRSGWFMLVKAFNLVDYVQRLGFLHLRPNR